MERIEFDVSTGERRVVQLNAEEVAAAEAQTAAVAPVEAIAAVNSAFEDAAGRLTAGYPTSEKYTWPIQEAEALAWSIGSQQTPYIDQVAQARGIPRETYLQKTLEKVQAFRAASAAMVGIRHKALDKIETAPDAAAVYAARDAAVLALKALP